MPISKTSQYIMPPLDASEDDRRGFLREALQDGTSFIQNQRSFKDIDLGVALISGEAYGKSLKGLSDIQIPMVKRDTREAVATLSNMRPLWGYKTDNEHFQKQAVVLNKMLRAWYYQPFVRHSIRASLQYAAGCGLGWASPVWKSDAIISGRGDIALDVFGPNDVKPYGIGKDNDIQKAYIVTIRYETPLQIAMAMFPDQLDLVVPNRGVPTWMKKGARRVQKFISPLLRAFGPGSDREKTDNAPFPMVDIYHSYILDLSVNMTGQDIFMGDPGTKWYYKVPSYESDIQTGMKDKNGQALIRKATVEDSRLFPLRRRAIWTDQGILKDGTSPWWHGKVPVIPFTTDDWPWDFLGYPMARDGAPIEKSATRILRAIDDSVNVKLDPPVTYDETAMGQGLMERLNLRKPGQRIKINATQNDKPVQPLLPSDFYSVDAVTAATPDKLFEYMHYVLGTRDIQALAKAKQVPSGDSIEKIMELAGPIVADMSSNMEGSMVLMGEMWKGLAFEFYDIRRRVQVLGDDGVSEEDYDFDPGNMIPSHLPDEFEEIKKNEALSRASETPYQIPDSRSSIVERAKIHLNSFVFHVTPNSLHQITQLTKKMLLMNLWKIGFPIDPWTVGEAMDLTNYGTASQLKKIPGFENIPDDIFGKWILWMELKAKMMPQKEQPGRKGSGQVPPTVQHKDGGARTTQRESPR